MPPATSASRWTFTVPTPLGAMRSSYLIDDEGVRFESDDLLGGAGGGGGGDGGGEHVRWDTVVEGGTATMAGMGGRGGPDLPTWVPEQLEWLTLSHTGASSSASGGQGFMRQLPPGADRDAIVDAVRRRLGQRWIGERLPLNDTLRRLGIRSKQWSGLKVAGLVVAVLALLALSIVAIGLLLRPVVIVPIGVLFGGWLVRMGVQRHRAGVIAASAPMGGIGAQAPARLGLIRLEGRVVAPEPPVAPAAVTGRHGVWWDATVSLWYEDDAEGGGEWRQVAARHGGEIDTLAFDSQAGRLPVWLKDAELLLEQRSWESRKDALPPPGVAWLDALGFPWHGSQKIRVTEECVAADATLYVVGTLDERRNLPATVTAGLLERTRRAIETGEWRRNVVAAMPPSSRAVVAVFIGFLDLFGRVGSARDRPRRALGNTPPAIAPDARLVWKGRSGHPLLVSDQPETAALAALRHRALVLGGIGVAIVVFAVSSMFEGT